MIKPDDAIFAALAVFVLGTGILVVISRNIVRSAFSLVLCFLGVAGIYAQLNYGFLALAQVLVYAGAISVLILFAILTVASPNMENTNLSSGRWRGAAIAVTAFAAISIYLIRQSHWVPKMLPASGDSVGMIGELFLGRYAVPLEAAAVLLLVALIGAVILVKEEK